MRQRFSASERFLHWLTAASFFVLLITGLLVGRRGAFHDVMYAVHLAAAAIFLLGVVLVYLLSRQKISAVARELSSLDLADRKWLRTAPAHLLGSSKEPAPSGKFNAGQKMNFILATILFLVLYITGVDTVFVGTHHNLIFGIHKIGVVVISFLVAGHLYMALINGKTRPAIRGMVTGKVDEKWAREHYPHWEP